MIISGNIYVIVYFAFFFSLTQLVYYVGKVKIGKEQISQDGMVPLLPHGLLLLPPHFVSKDYAPAEIAYSTAHAHHEVLAWSLAPLNHELQL